MNAILLQLIRDLAARDARRGRPERSLPHLLTFASAQHPEREIREVYAARLVAVQRAMVAQTARRAVVP